MGGLFFYRPFHNYFFSNHEYETLFFATMCALSVTRFCYSACAILFLSHTHLVFDSPMDGYSWFWICLSVLGFILAFFIIGDYLPRNLGNRFPEKTVRAAAPLSSFFLLLAFPICYVFLKISESFSRIAAFDQTQEPSDQAKQEIMNILQEAEVAPSLDYHDKKLIESVFTFRDLIVREVMVPRVDVFSLEASTSIMKAAQVIEEEGYSRIPVYRNTVDNIIGILMYKDVLYKYQEYERKKDPKILEAPIESIQKSVLYTPETKKISSLLQEFRKKQVHFAIVVDEYGGTEGIVTIEDILEELVGDIADEYDEEEELFVPYPGGGWIVDARMNILDAEEQLGIKIPQEGEYDTIGGYIFHCTGTIPSKGFVIHHDDFEIEILRANERSVEKVKIKPLHKKAEEAT